MARSSFATIFPGVSHPSDLSVGLGSFIGSNDSDENMPTQIGTGVRIGSFCLIEAGSTIGNDVEIGDYVKISRTSVVGDGSIVLEKVHIHPLARIGKNCIVGGDLAERVVLEDNVTFMGEVAHSHRHPTNVSTWQTTDEVSPTVRRGSVVGVRALLIGGIVVGPGSYIAAGEIVRCDVPPGYVFYHGELSLLSSWRGLIRVRDSE